MVKIIERNDSPSFGERVARGFNNASKQFPESFKNYADYRKRESDLTEKKTRNLRKVSDPYLKKFHESILEDEGRYNTFNDLAKKYVESGYSDDDAIRGALADLRSRGGTISSGKSSARGTADADKFVGGALGKYLEPAKEAIKKKPSLLATEAPVAGLKSLENLAALHDPATTLINLFSKKKPVTASGLAANKLRQGLDPELHEGAERVSDIGSVLLDLLTPLPKGAAAAKVAPVLEKEAARAVPQALRRAEGSISKELPKGATLPRIERAAPEGKLFKRAEQEGIREQQLKLHPKYAEEIASDAAERAARLEAKMPKTAVGEAGVAKRMSIAEAELPKAKELYQKAISRVRGLENELARGVPEAQKAASESLYNMAVKELNDAEFYLKTVLNNSKTGEGRVGLEQMRQSARNKMLKIEDEVLSGHEAKLSPRDYNPETIKKAKSLEKKKPLPASRHEDYFTQVHEGYANEYRQRIADLDRELEKLKRVPGMAPLQRGIQINREKDVLKKLTDHIDAENAIHRHKMGLRETHQRQVAKERLGEFTKQAGEKRVKDLAKEALSSPEKAAQATETAFEEAMNQAKSGAARETLAAEKAGVKDRMQKAASERILNVPGTVTGKDAQKSAFRIMENIQEVIKSLKGEGPTFFQTRIGKDLLFGVGGQLIGEVLHEFDIPVSQSAAISAILGGTTKGAGTRYIIGALTKALINKSKKSKYKEALRNGDDEKLIEMRKKLSTRLRKEAKEEFKQEANL